MRRLRVYSALFVGCFGVAIFVALVLHRSGDTADDAFAHLAHHAEDEGTTGRAFAPLNRTLDAAIAAHIARPFPSAQHRMRKHTSCPLWGVVTTVRPPSDAVRDAVERMCTLVVLDVNSPPYEVRGAVVLDATQQEDPVIVGDLARVLPWRHFGRKNVGYLHAIAHGAQWVWDFDDDNRLLPNATLAPPTRALRAHTNCSTLNPYGLLGAPPDAYPRGLPLDHVRAPCEVRVCAARGAAGAVVVQSGATLAPDVDAIMRLTHAPFALDMRAMPVATAGSGAYMPYNAQATLVGALWSLYLPVSVPGRVSDIWRAYYAQRLMRDLGMVVVHTAPLVEHVRAPHNLLADMDAEADLYAKAGALVAWLDAWTSIDTNLARRAVSLAAHMHAGGFWGERDVLGVYEWHAALHRLGYAYPSRRAPSEPCEESVVDHADPVRPSPMRATEVVHTTSSVGLFVCVTSRFLDEMHDQLVYSMRALWPRAPESGGALDMHSLTMVFDDDVPEDHAHAVEEVLRMQRDVRSTAHFMPARPEVYHSKGHTRQQWAMFWADNYTDAPLVGFVDTDAVFVAPVSDAALFDGAGRPRVLATVGAPANHWWSSAPAATYVALGHLEAMRCMTYFPVVVKREHLAPMRAHITQAVGAATFDDAFARFSRGIFSQFNIMCNYLWYHHRDEYAWTLQERVRGWRGNVPGQISAETLDALVKANVSATPVPRVAAHWGYVSPGHTVEEAVTEGLCRGACRATNDSAVTTTSTIAACVCETQAALCSRCAHVKKRTSDVHELMFEFEDAVWHKGRDAETEVLPAQRAYYAQLRK